MRYYFMHWSFFLLNTMIFLEVQMINRVIKMSMYQLGTQNNIRKASKVFLNHNSASKWRSTKQFYNTVCCYAHVYWLIYFNTTLEHSITGAHFPGGMRQRFLRRINALTTWQLIFIPAYAISAIRILMLLSGLTLTQILYKGANVRFVSLLIAQTEYTKFFWLGFKDSSLLHPQGLENFPFWRVGFSLLFLLQWVLQ